MFEAWHSHASELTSKCTCPIIATMIYDDITCASTALSIFLNRIVHIDPELSLSEFATRYRLKIVYQTNYWRRDYIYATEGNIHAERAFLINYKKMISNTTTFNWKDRLLLAIGQYCRNRNQICTDKSYDDDIYFCILYDEYLYPDKHCIVIQTVDSIHHLKDPLCRTCLIISNKERLCILRSCLTLLTTL